MSEAVGQRIKDELAGRSFRQFEPSRNAVERKAVILDFSDGVTLWAQYSRDDHALSEWEITARDYRIEARGDHRDEITIHVVEPRSRQQFPEVCEDCIETSTASISIRIVFGARAIRFRINDSEGTLPSPFSVFGSWTRFEEDESFD